MPFLNTILSKYDIYIPVLKWVHWEKYDVFEKQFIYLFYGKAS